LLQLQVGSYRVAQSLVTEELGAVLTDPVGQQPVAQLVLTTWVCFLQAL